MISMAWLYSLGLVLAYNLQVTGSLPNWVGSLDDTESILFLKSLQLLALNRTTV